MNFNKCKRCGAFFITNSNVCPNCLTKDNADISKLKSFLSENDCPNSLEALAIDTGISEKNLNRFLLQEDLTSYAIELGIKNNIEL